MNLYGLSDKGAVRSENQDCFHTEVFGDIVFAVVCDGMGGAKSGGVASAETLGQILADVRRAAQDEEIAQADPADLARLLAQAVRDANRKVFAMSQTKEEYKGMGTTCTAVLCRGAECAFAHVGDSRAYSIVPGESYERITRDHTMVQKMVERGELTPEQAEIHPKRNYITRAVGVGESVEPDVFTRRLLPGEILLLCSDGLYGYLFSEDELPELVLQATKVLSAAPLIEKANAYGGGDNITAVIFDPGREAGE